MALNDLPLKAYTIVLLDIDKTVSDTHILELLFFLRRRDLSRFVYGLWVVKMYVLYGPFLKLLDKISRPLLQVLIYNWYARYDDEELVVAAHLLFREQLQGKCYPEMVAFLTKLQEAKIPFHFISTNISPVARAYANHFGGGYQAIDLSQLRGADLKTRLKYLRNFKADAVSVYPKEGSLAVADSLRYDAALFAWGETGRLVAW